MLAARGSGKISAQLALTEVGRGQQHKHDPDQVGQQQVDELHPHRGQQPQIDHPCYQWRYEHADQGDRQALDVRGSAKQINQPAEEEQVQAGEQGD